MGIQELKEMAKDSHEMAAEVSAIEQSMATNSKEF